MIERYQHCACVWRGKTMGQIAPTSAVPGAVAGAGTILFHESTTLMQASQYKGCIRQASLTKAKYTNLKQNNGMIIYCGTDGEK